MMSKSVKYEKEKPQWVGPYEVVKICSEHVYLIRSLDGDEFEVHAARLMFFAPSTFLANAATKAVYLNDAGKLEVKELCGLRKRRKQIEVRVWWRGFNQECDKTLEPVVMIAEDLPDVAMEYLKSLTSPLPKETLLMLSRLFDLVTAATINVVEVSSVGVDCDLVIVPVDDEAVFKVGWPKIEKELSRQCVRKYTFGSFEEYARHLPCKNHQQLYETIKKLSGKQAVRSYLRMHLDLVEVRKKNMKAYGCAYYVRKTLGSSKLVRLERFLTMLKYHQMHFKLKKS
eukprot:snap_masked-scaffold_3-processed-gene-3.18-mRNA-1 protein AED:1.00 eAED:1.00 QI:0/-1/0/0/-1/1/1/0/284